MTPFLCFQSSHWTIRPCCTANSSSPMDAPKTPRRPDAASETQSQVAVILMRHGQTDWNYLGRVQGGLDKSRLTQFGMRQARHAGEWLRYLKVDTILCSPLTRARDTLRLATDASRNRDLQAKKPEVLESLKEIQVPWQGLQKRDIPRSLFSEAYLQYTRNPPQFSYNGFSPLQDITRRARDVWSTVGRSSGACKLLVSHNQMNKALICAALGLPTVLSAWRQGNCCFNVIILEEGQPPKLRLCNGGDDTLEFGKRPKSLVRSGCVRVFLHYQGRWQALQRVVGRIEIEKYYLIGGTPKHDLEQLGREDLETKCERLPFPTNASCAYDSAWQILDQVRSSYKQKSIVVSVNDSLAYRAFFAASIGLGQDGIQRLVSDVGGVSVMDIRISDPVGHAVTFVEGYNIGAWLNSDALVSYTTHQHAA